LKHRLVQAAKAPEIVIPVGVLVVGLVGLALTLAVARPDPTAIVAIIGAIAATYPPITSLVVTRFFERQKEAALRIQEMEREARAKKVPEYEKFIGFLMDMFFASKLGKKALTEQQIVAGFVGWTKPLLIWGSDEVVRKWGRLRVDIADDRGIQGLFWLEDLLIEIRRDVGYPITTLGRGDILRLWVNDIDQHIAAAPPAASVNEAAKLDKGSEVEPSTELAAEPF
jgi:hypothetical protein